VTTAFTIVPIVEGDGEVEAVPVLLRRVVAEIGADVAITVAKPIRRPRGSLLKQGELERYVDLAARIHGGNGGVLVLIDADDDCAATLGPDLLARARESRPDSPVGVVLAVKEFECWFLAAAESIAGRRGLPQDLEGPATPEEVRDAKGWIQHRRTDGLAYGPTVDQPALTAVFDLGAARSEAPSFDKFWREVERLVTAAVADEGST
jgi:hypothetical protein